MSHASGSTVTSRPNCHSFQRESPPYIEGWTKQKENNNRQTRQRQDKTDMKYTWHQSISRKFPMNISESKIVLAKHFVCSHEGLSLDPQHSRNEKFLDVMRNGMCLKPCSWGGGVRRILEGHWPASLSQTELQTAFQWEILSQRVWKTNEEDTLYGMEYPSHSRSPTQQNGVQKAWRLENTFLIECMYKNPL